MPSVGNLREIDGIDCLRIFQNQVWADAPQNSFRLFPFDCPFRKMSLTLPFADVDVTYIPEGF